MRAVTVHRAGIGRRPCTDSPTHSVINARHGKSAHGAPPRPHGHACWHPPHLARTAILPQKFAPLRPDRQGLPDRGYIEPPTLRLSACGTGPRTVWRGRTSVDSALARCGRQTSGRTTRLNGAHFMGTRGVTLFTCPSVTGFLRETSLRWRSTGLESRLGQLRGIARLSRCAVSFPRVVANLRCAREAQRCSLQ